MRNIIISGCKINKEVCVREDHCSTVPLKPPKCFPTLTFDPVCVCVFGVQMQGAGTKSWNRLSALFNKDDEHQLLEETESPPVADQ